MRRIASDSTSRASEPRALRYPDSRRRMSICKLFLSLWFHSSSNCSLSEIVSVSWSSMLWGAIDGTSEFARVWRPSANLHTAPMSRLAFGAYVESCSSPSQFQFLLPTRHDWPNRMLLRTAEQESTRVSHAFADRCGLWSLCMSLGSAFQNVLTTNRVVSSDWVTCQHCPKIAPAKQPFTIT